MKILSNICKDCDGCDNWIGAGRDVLKVEADGLLHVAERLGPSFTGAVKMLAKCQGRVAVTGVGKSGLVGRKIAATLSSTGTPAFFLHPSEGAHGDLGAIRDGDVVIAISYSGKTPEVKALLEPLKKIGAKIIAITAGLKSPLAAAADLVIDAAVPREACPHNLAPTASSTAALGVGDALAVCLIKVKSFTAGDFKLFHPGGALGQRLGLKVGDIMQTRNMPLAAADDSVKHALAILDRGGVGAVILTDVNGSLCGIITDGDVRRLVCANRLSQEHPASEIMTAAPRYAGPDQSAAEVMDIMEQKAITVLPVVDQTLKPVGIIHLHDILGKGRISFAD